MSDGGLIRRFLSCAFDVYVDPLTVARSICKFVDHFLRYFDPVAGRQVPAEKVLKIGIAVDKSLAHRPAPPNELMKSTNPCQYSLTRLSRLGQCVVNADRSMCIA